MIHECTIAEITIGPRRPLALIAGPCVLESPRTNNLIAQSLRDTCAELGMPFIFKASFDKANRSSIRSARGPGLEDGLDELRRIRTDFEVPVTTDVHLPDQAAPTSAVADLLQVPAFLCRQTDLLVACAVTGKPVNVKKGQFLSPAEMKHVIKKLDDGGCRNIMLTERGTFFGYNRLVNDFIGIGDMLDLGRAVCFDVTHSTQLPGAGEQATGGRPDRAALLARAAVAAGVHAVFIECHPNPAKSLSDASTMQPLSAMPDLLRQLQAIRAAVTEDQSASIRR
jgi:2-dehydro-3-deoxyphosphooctonate aldolase (KDO 8-P synthase)